MAPDPCPPDPPAGLDPLVETLPEAAELYRIHAPAFGAARFNPWTNLKAQPTRFAPSPGPRGRPVPTLYAAPSFSVALAESLFHDLPRDSAEVVVPASRLGKLCTGKLDEAFSQASHRKSSQRRGKCADRGFRSGGRGLSGARVSFTRDTTLFDFSACGGLGRGWRAQTS